MKQFRCGITDARRLVAAIAVVVLGAASSSAQSAPSAPPPADATAAAAAQICPMKTASGGRLPDSIQVVDDLRQRLSEMLERSATFRSQCRRIAEAPQLTVIVRLDLRMTGRVYRALTKICRQRSGVLVATIDIAAYGDPAEWIAHEFEHLVEQLDGVDLHDLERRKQGAWRSGSQTFETERAVRAGRQVAREMREPAIGGGLEQRVAADPNQR